MRTFIDANVFIYALEKHPGYGEKAKMILEKVDTGEVDGYISTLVLLEVCWYLEAAKRLEIMALTVERVTRSRVNLVEVAGANVVEAAELKKAYEGVDFNDLVNYSVMRRLGLEAVYTNDAHFNKLPGVKMLF